MHIERGRDTIVADVCGAVWCGDDERRVLRAAVWENEEGVRSEARVFVSRGMRSE